MSRPTSLLDRNGDDHYPVTKDRHSGQMPAAAMPTPSGDPKEGTGASLSDREDRSVQVHQDGSTVVISVRDQLDATAGRSLLECAAGAVAAEGIGRLDIDLRELRSFTAQGVRALVASRSLGAELPDGLHYRTGRGAGRDALLAAYRNLQAGATM